MEIFKADPFTFSSRVLHGLDRNFILATAHGKLVVAVTTYRLLCKGL